MPCWLLLWRWHDCGYAMSGGLLWQHNGTINSGVFRGMFFWVLLRHRVRFSNAVHSGVLPCGVFLCTGLGGGAAVYGRLLRCQWGSGDTELHWPLCSWIFLHRRVHDIRAVLILDVSTRFLLCTRNHVR